MFEAFLGGFAILFDPQTVVMTFVMMSAGLFLGMFVGALPGFTTLMALAILLPVRFFIHPLLGIPFLLGVYKGGIYGGSIPAILVSMPGTGAAVATTFDGPALTRKGQARKALEMALFASVAGDLSSDIITIALIGPIAAVALLMGPPELCAILFMSLIVSAGTTSAFEGVPTFKDLGYSADIGKMYRVIMAPRGLPADRLAKLQDALLKLQDHKTYQRLIDAIGEKREYINGPEYEKLRPLQSAAYQKMIEGLAKK